MSRFKVNLASLNSCTKSCILLLVLPYSWTPYMLRQTKWMDCEGNLELKKGSLYRGHPCLIGNR